jgi:hypothetical protein
MLSKVDSSTFSRIVGAVRLDRDAFGEIDADSGAQRYAIAIVILAGLANGVANAWTSEQGWAAILLGVVGSVIAWALFSGVSFAVAQGVLPGEATLGESTGGGVFRVVGFAQAPNILGIAAAIGALGLLVSFLGLLWMVVCSIVGISVALRVSTGRALAIGLIAGFITLILISLFIALWTGLFF